MTQIRKLTGQVGGWWTGVKFHFGEAPEADRKMEPTRFCEAIAAARTRAITLVPELVDCPGARRSLFWADNGDARLAEDMAAKNGLAPEVAADLVFDTPRLRSRPSAVTLGEVQDPDVVISFIQAEAAMRLARRWESRRGQVLSAALPSTMAVCGNVAVKAYLTGLLCLSFGCPDSRRYGAIGRDQLVVGLPISLAKQLA